MCVNINTKSTDNTQYVVVELQRIDVEINQYRTKNRFHFTKRLFRLGFCYSCLVFERVKMHVSYCTFS